MVSAVLVVAAVLAAEPKVGYVVHAGDAKAEALLETALKAELGAGATNLSKVDSALFPADLLDLGAKPSADMPEALKADWIKASAICKAYPTPLARSGCAARRSESLWARYLSSLGLTEVLEVGHNGRALTIGRYDPRQQGAVQHRGPDMSVEEAARYLKLSVLDARTGVGMANDRPVSPALPEAEVEAERRAFVVAITKRKDLAAVLKGAVEKDGLKVTDATPVFQSLQPDWTPFFDEPLPKAAPEELAPAWKAANERCLARVGTINRDTNFSVAASAGECGKQRADYVWAQYLKLMRPTEVIEVTVSEDEPDAPPTVLVAAYAPPFGYAYGARQEVSAANLASALPGLVSDARNAKQIVGGSRAWSALPPAPKEVLETLAGAQSAVTPVKLPAKCDVTLPSALTGPDVPLWKSVADRWAASVKDAKQGPPVACKARAWIVTERTLMGLIEVANAEAECGGRFARGSSMTTPLRGGNIADKLSKDLVTSLLKNLCSGKGAPAAGK